MNDNETRKVTRAYALYSALGSESAGAQVYVDTQDGHAYRVVEVQKDADGDLILKTVEYSPKTKLVKHS